MLERVKFKASGTNAIGPWVAVSAWVLPKAGARRRDQIDKAIASPQDVFDAQQALFEEAARRLGSCFLMGFSIGLVDDEMTVAGSLALQINARYQGYGDAQARIPMTVRQVAAALAPGKTRAIELE